MNTLNSDRSPKIKINDIENAVKGVIKFASENPQLQNQLFGEEFPIFLQVNSFKIPRTDGPVKQVYRVPLAHAAIPLDADICLIVPDVKGIPNKEHESHLEHYESLLNKKGVTGIKKILTFHELRTEYETFELKNRLVDLYDIFLVDGRISGKVIHFCGKIFYKKRKVPLSVKLHLNKLKEHIDQSLKKVYFRISLKSDSHIVQIGHSKMKVEHLVENVNSVVDFITKQFPGKMDNIRSLNVYAYRGSSIPIYVSFKNPNDVKVPKLSTKKPKAYKSYTGELTTLYNAQVTVKPSGQVVVKRSKLPEVGNMNDIITDDDIMRENKESDLENGNETKPKKSKKRKISEVGYNVNNDSSDLKSKKKKAVKNVFAEKPKSEDYSPGKFVKVKHQMKKIKSKVEKLEKDKTIEKVSGLKVAKPINKKKKLVNKTGKISSHTK